MGDTAKILLGTAGIREAEALRARLSREGHEIALIHNQQTCTRGCSVQVEIWAHPDDAPAIVALLQQDRLQAFGELGYDPQLAEQVYDPTAATATCPACGTVFATTASECPDCGLCFGDERPAEAQACKTPGKARA